MQTGRLPEMKDLLHGKRLEQIANKNQDTGIHREAFNLFKLPGSARATVKKRPDSGAPGR
jgi:hypothetical protein